MEVVQRRMKQRRLDCPYVFHRNGKEIKDYRDAWAAACRNLSRAAVPEQIAIKIIGHKTASMYRRYRIVDERDLREATQNLNAYLEAQPINTVVAPIRKAVGE